MTIAPLTAPMSLGGSAQTAVFRIGAGGGIHRHPASVPQIVAVLEGSGEVSGGDGRFHAVGPGAAVYFSMGEEHETRTAEGMVVLIIEGSDLAPPRTRPGTENSE